MNENRDIRINGTGKYGEGRNDIKKIYFRTSLADPNKVERIYIKRNNAKVQKIVKRNTDENFNKTALELLKKVNAPKEQGNAWGIYAYENRKNVFNNLERTADRPYKFAAIATSVATVGLVAATLASCGKFKDKQLEEEVVQEISIDTNNEIEEEHFVDIEGQNYDFYVENAYADNYQKSYKMAKHDFLDEFGNSEDWMNVKLSQEQIDYLTSIGYELDGDEVVFNFTIEDIEAFDLEFGHHTNDELVSINNGNLYDLNAIIEGNDSNLNSFIYKAIAYYANSNVDYIDYAKFTSFNESEIADITKFEDLNREYKALLSDGKYKEAEAKMKEIKSELVNYARLNDLQDENARAYILRVFAPVFSMYSQMYGYQDTITLNLYDTKTNAYVEKQVKTNLFDEITMRDLVQGYKDCKDKDGNILEKGFNSIEFLKQFSIDSNRYEIVVSDDGVSIADRFSSELSNKLKNANDYITSLRTENAAADAGVVNADNDAIRAANEILYNEGSDVVLTNDKNNNSKLDELTKGGYDSEVINELINNDMKEKNKYPKNVNYYYSELSNFIRQWLDYVNKKYGSTINKAGQQLQQARVIARTVTHTVTHREVVHEDVPQSEIDEQFAKYEKEAKEGKVETTVKDANGNSKTTTLQDLYNAAVNSMTNGATSGELNSNGYTYTPGTTSSDPLANKTIEYAKEDAKQINEELAKNGTTKIGEVKTTVTEHTDDKYKDADTTTDDNFAEEYNRRLEEEKAKASTSTTSSNTETVSAPSSNTETVSVSSSNTETVSVSSSNTEASTTTPDTSSVEASSVTETTVNDDGSTNTTNNDPTQEDGYTSFTSEEDIDSYIESLIGGSEENTESNSLGM